MKSTRVNPSFIFVSINFFVSFAVDRKFFPDCIFKSSMTCLYISLTFSLVLSFPLSSPFSLSLSALLGLFGFGEEAKKGRWYQHIKTIKSQHPK